MNQGQAIARLGETRVRDKKKGDLSVSL